MKKYTKVGPYEIALSVYAVDEAFSQIGYRVPCLVTGKTQAGTGRRIAKHLCINHRWDKTLGESEWFLEWNGKRVGSLGC